MVYLAILALDVYALVAVMTPGRWTDATQVISLQIAQNGFQFGRAGYASAMGVVLFFFTLIIAAIMLRATRRQRIEYQGAMAVTTRTGDAAPRPPRRPGSSATAAGLAGPATSGPTSCPTSC